MNKLYFIILIFIVLSSCSILDREKQVKLEVTGTAREIRIHWEHTEGGGNYYVSNHWFNEILLWIRMIDGEKGDYVFLRATNVDCQTLNGTVNVAIYVNGTLFKTSSCQGYNSQTAVWGTIK